MERKLYFPLLMLALVALSQGLAGDSQQKRLFQKLEKICDELERSNKILFGSMKSLEQHAGALHVLADEIDKIHKEFTDDMIIKSGVVVGGDLITFGGVAWEYFKKGSPVISIMGLGISLLGRYMQESTWSQEQAHSHKITDLADQIFRACKKTLQEVSDQYQEMQWRFRYLEEEEKERAGTALHKKITQIKNSFSHFEPPKIEKQFTSNKNGLFNFLLSVGFKSGGIRESLEKVVPGLVKPASEAISKTGVSTVQQVNKLSSSFYLYEAVVAVVSLYSDGNEIYEGITHRNEGAPSELAKSIRTMAMHLKVVTQSLDSVLSKGKRGYRSCQSSGSF